MLISQCRIKVTLLFYAYITLYIYFNVESGVFCPIVFDGWMCVNATRAGEEAVFGCPNFKHLDYLSKSK